MRPSPPATLEEALERLKKFERLLAPTWMTLACNAMAENPEPTDDARMFNFMGCGGSDWTTYGEFKELLGSPWETE